MQFSVDQIELACRMKDSGLPWEPQVGHYVYDRSKVCQRGSPFQEGVYFILDYPCFCRHVGGADTLEREMVWLPTWYDCRMLLKQGGVADAEVVAVASAGIPAGAELTHLYEKMIATAAIIPKDNVADARPANPANAAGDRSPHGVDVRSH